MQGKQDDVITVRKAGLRRRLLGLFLGLSGGLLVVPSGAIAQSDGGAQSWPARPVKIVVPWSAGGSSDTVARLLSEQLSKTLGQSVIVENRPGATGKIGVETVIRAQPDGYTFLLGTLTDMAIAPAIMPSLSYDVARDLKPVSYVSTSPHVLVVAAGFPPNSLSELVAYAKANPGKVSAGTAGIGTSNHLSGIQLNLAAGIDTVQVPYKGSGPALVDLLGGQIQYLFEVPAITRKHVEAGKLKAIAVATERRLPRMPGVPTMAEAGMPDFVAGTWTGLLAPAGTPDAIVERLQAAVVAALKSPEITRSFDELDLIAVGSTPARFGAFIKAESARYRALAARVNLKLE